MMKHYLLLLAGYLAFVWQAALRPELSWNGYAPNFLALVLLLVMWTLSDLTALIAATGLGLLSDCLASRSLGNDMLCFLAVAIFLQTICPPRLVRHPGWLVGLVLLTTLLAELSTTGLRGMLNHELATDGTPSFVSLRWFLTALGDAVYTASLAMLPVLAMLIWRGRFASSGHQPALGRWHRLTS